MVKTDGTINLTKLSGALVIVGALAGAVLSYGPAVTDAWFNISAPPGAPTNVAATSGVGKITVSWSAGTNGSTATTNYRIYRSTAPFGGSYVAVHATVGVVYSYDDTAVVLGTRYYYRVAAVNSVGQSPLSAEVSNMPGIPGAPGTPTFTSVAATSMRVNWTAASGADSYKLERCTGVGCSSFVQIASGVTTLFYDDSGLSPNTSYSYRVRATGGGGDGSYSGIGTQVTTAPSVPSAPTSLLATSGTNTIGVTWNAPASNGGSPITAYKLYRDTNPAPTTLYQTLGNVTNYTDTSVVVGTTYYYRVKAVNAIGDSAYSNESSTSAVCGSGPSGGNLTGWAWSDTIGWISLNGSDTGACTTVTYGLTLSGSNITGYAWSENIGWIQFGGLSGFPVGAGTVSSNATVQGSNVVGWARALSYTDAQAGGWDGWISLSGTGYGVTMTEGALTGWAWGDTNLGWIDFSANYPCGATAGFYCSADVRHHRNLSCGEDTIIGVPETCGYACSAGACVPPPNPTGTLGSGLAIRITPTLVRPNGTVTIQWGTQDTTSCTVTENNTSITDSWTGTSGSQTSSPINKTTTYTLSCQGEGGTSLNQSATVRTTARWREI